MLRIDLSLVKLVSQKQLSTNGEETLSLPYVLKYTQNTFIIYLFLKKNIFIFGVFLNNRNNT